MVLGITMIPLGVCLYIYDTNLTTCSLGILKEAETGEDLTLYTKSEQIRTDVKYEKMIRGLEITAPYDSNASYNVSIKI